MKSTVDTQVRVCVIVSFLAIILPAQISKAVKLEFDQQSSSSTLSVSAHVYAGQNVDDDSWQTSDIVYDYSLAASAAETGAWSSASSSVHSDVNNAYSDEDGYIHQAKLSEFIYTLNFRACPFIDHSSGEPVVTPAGFDAHVDVDGTLCWNLLPSNPQEKVGDTVLIALWDRYSAGGNSTNMTYQNGTSKEYWVGSQVLGPYYVESVCPPCDWNVTDPGEPVYVMAWLGDKIKVLYHGYVDGHPYDNTQYSDFWTGSDGPTVQVSIRTEVEPLNITLIDKGWVSKNKLLGNLQNRSDLSPEMEQEYKAHGIVKGACADGATQLVLFCDWYHLFNSLELPGDTDKSLARFRLSILSPDGKDNGQLVLDGQDNDNDGYDDTPRIKNETFTQTWIAPPVFDSVLGSANQEKMRQIPIQIEIDKDGDGTFEYTFTRYIELIRPPVVMVHGLWGNPGDFSALGNALDANGWLYLCLASYDNKASFATNIPKVKADIINSLNGPRRAMYAATKVDVVAHSMGGLLVKKLDTDFAQKNIRKIITIGSPYMGSPLADDLYKLLAQDPVGAQRLEKILNLKFGITNSITGGAIADLRSENNPQLPISTQVLGVDCQEIFVGLRDGTISDWGLNTFVTGLMLLYRQWTPEATHHIIFGTANSDWVVPESSQIYDASQHHTLYVPWHCVEPKNDVFIAHTISTLNQAADIGQTIAASRLKVNSDLESRQQQCEPTVLEFSNVLLSNPNGTVEIVNPTEGQICEAGESIAVSVQGTGDTTQAAVFAFFGSSSWADIVQLPWTGDVNVPSDSVGSTAKIYAIGLDADMNMTDEDEANLMLESDIVLQEIFLGFGDTWYFDFITDPTQSRQLQLYPMGRFSDDSEHPLSVLGQTGYASSNENVASVDANGLITVHSKGTSEITVTNSGVDTIIEVEVDTYLGDINLDGKVDFIDFAILANQWNQPPAYPSADIVPEGGDNIVDINDLKALTDNWLEGIRVVGIIPPDLNYDKMIDFVDFALFANNWLEIDCETSNDWCASRDFDKSGSVDIFDLAELARNWLAGK